MILLMLRHVVIASPVFIAIYMIYNLAPTLLALAISMPVLLLASFAESRTAERIKTATEQNDMASAFKLIYISMKFEGKALLSSICNIRMVLENDAHIKPLLDELRMRLMLGQKLPEAMRALHNNSISANAAKELYSMAERCATDGSAMPFKTMSERLQNEHKYIASRNEGSLQKYLTLSMLVSSVIPSFALFSFVGYSMLMPSMLQSLAFMLIITILIPAVYGMIRAHIDEISNYY